MKTALSLFLAVLVVMLACSSFVQPILTIRADTSPFKWKPEKIWTKPIPNGKFGEFCIYDMDKCSNQNESIRDRLRVNHADQLAVI
jgi:hypothetical protein